MSDFIIITKARVLENEPEEIIKEQEEKRKVLGLGDKNFLCHFHSSPYTSDKIVEMPIEFAIQHLAIKESMIDFVKAMSFHIKKTPDILTPLFQPIISNPFGTPL